MPQGKITARLIEALQPGDRDTFLWDQTLKGFGCKVSPSGRKTYVFQYRMGGREAKTQRVAIGRHGSPWTPSSARAEAERLSREIAGATDPRTKAREEARARSELAFDDFAARFLDEYAKRSWRPRTYSSQASNLQRWVTPVLKDMPLPMIQRRDIIAVLRDIPAESPALARSVFAVISKLFNWAVEVDVLKRSPMEGMKRPTAEKPRDRVLNTREVMLVAAFAGGLGAPFDRFVRMLIITGQRRNEVVGMTWNEVDRDTAEWVIPAHRCKNDEEHTVPLPALAIRELDDVAGDTVWPRKGYVFSTTGRTPISGFSRMKTRLNRLIASNPWFEPLPDWRLHDLRRTFATNLQRLGVRFEVTEALLNHLSSVRSGATAPYLQHDWAPEKRLAMEAWSDRLQDMLDEFKEAGAAARAAGGRKRLQAPQPSAT